MNYFVYIIECVDGSFYTGFTNDVEARFKRHLSGNGASYTRSHKPVRVVYTQMFDDKSLAMKEEIRIKRLPRKKKELIISLMT